MILDRDAEEVLGCTFLEISGEIHPNMQLHTK